MLEKAYTFERLCETCKETARKTANHVVKDKISTRIHLEEEDYELIRFNKMGTQILDM